MRAAPLVLFFSAAPAFAAPTTLALNPDEGGEAYSADYSQAVHVEARLTSGGAPIAGERVTFRLMRGDDEDTAFVFDDPVTDAQGYATARLTLVDGRHGGQTFPAAARTPESEGERYVITARFQGDPFAEDCDSDGGPLPDGGDPDLCAAEASVALFVALETTSLALQPGLEVELGGTLPLVATLTDDNGDAAQAGTDVDGTSAKPLEGRRVGFFYDVNGNGRPENAERIPCANSGESHAVTNADGVAVCDFFADPAFVDTVNVDEAIHAQFGGDERYALSGAAQALTVRAAKPDPAATLLTATPESAPADGVSVIDLRATLVDTAGNPLGADDPPYSVELESDLGTFVEEATRDPLTGHYLARLRAPRDGGDATVRVVVEDEPGATLIIPFVENGCTCTGAGSPREGALALLGVAALGLSVIRRRRETP